MHRLNKYNEETINVINKFINDFLCVFPNILTKDELIDRIILNMDENVALDYDLEKGQMGMYNPNEKRIYVSKFTDNKDKTIFHEFIHVITFCDFFAEYKYKNLIEAITSLVEEKYYNYIIKPDKVNRVNDYMYEFVKELDFVTNGELTEQFLINPNDIYKLFIPNSCLYDANDVSDNEYIDVLKCFCEYNDQVILGYENNLSDTDMYKDILTVESLILEQYILRVKLGKEEFNMKKLVDLYFRQIYPNIDKFLDFIDEMIEKNIINESDVLKYDMLGNLYLLKKNNMNIDNFKNVDYGVREIEWLASKIFGYSNFIDSDVSVSDLDYMISQNISVDEFNTLNEYYNDSIPVFTKLTEYIVDDKIRLEDLNNCNLRLGDNIFSSTFVKNILDVGNNYYRYYNTGRSTYKSFIEAFVLEENDCIKYIIDDNNVYSSIDYDSFISRFRSSNIFDSLYEYFITYLDSDCIYVDSNIGTDDLNINFYVLSDNELYKVAIKIVDDMLYDCVKIINLDDNVNKLFMDSRKDKIKCKSI